MIDPAILLPYVVACFIFAAVPGPSVTVVLANSLARGTAAGLWTILGTELSMLSMVLIVALGLSAVVAVIGAGFFWIKLAGVAYLVWIGVKMWRATGELHVAHGRVRNRLDYILQGALVNWANPKTLLFLGAFLPQFVDLSRPAFPQIMVLGLIVMAVATVTDTIYRRPRPALDQRSAHAHHEPCRRHRTDPGRRLAGEPAADLISQPPEAWALSVAGGRRQPSP